MQRHITVSDEAWKSCLAGVPWRYEDEFADLEGASLRNATAVPNSEIKCLLQAMTLPSPTHIIDALWYLPCC